MDLELLRRTEYNQQYIAAMRPVFNRRALFTDTSAEYVIPEEPACFSEVTIRFRTARNNVDRVFLVCGGQKHLMVRVESNNDFDYYAYVMRLDDQKVSYYFEVQTGRITGIYDMRGLVQEVNEYYDFIIIPGFHTPDWAKGAVMYQIYTDRFCNGDPSNDPENVVLWREHGSVTNEECFGGDLAGITDKLDYLQNLGINGLYLTPINEAPSNHKYDTTDYTKIDPRFGDEETFKHLVKEAHKRGIRVMLDGVFNHSGYYFAPWQDVLAKGPESEYYDWFMINEWPFDKNGQAAKKKQYYTFAFFDSMPKINTNNPKVRKYFVDICANWVENYGIDGIRLDVANEVSHRFCKELHARVKEINPDIYILGEIWHNALPWLRGDEFDAVMNYPFKDATLAFVKGGDARTAAHDILRICEHYPAPALHVLMNFMSTHDTVRAITAIAGESCEGRDRYWQSARRLTPEQYENGRRLMTLAYAMIFTLPGIPSIYYGDEIGMQGYKDPFNRAFFDWESRETRIRPVLQNLAALRKSCPAFADGTLAVTQAQGGVLCYERRAEAAVAAVCINRTEQQVRTVLLGRTVEVQPCSFAVVTDPE